MSLLARYSDILLDEYSLPLFHSKPYKNILPIILAKYNVHITRIAIIEFLSILNYYKKKYNPEKIMEYFRKFYRIIDIDDKIIYKASLYLSELVRHKKKAKIIDAINAAISTEKNMIIITNDKSRYEEFLKYGVICYNIDEFTEYLRREAQKE